MSVEAQTVEYSYLGNGVSTEFAFPSRFLSAVDLLVGVDGVQITTGFVVEGAGAETGGLVRFAVAPSNGAKIVLVRAPPISQLLDFVNGQTVLEDTLDTGLDKLTMIAQHFARGARRTLRIGEFVPDPLANMELPSAAERKDRYLRFGSLGEVELASQASVITLTVQASFPSRLAVTAATLPSTTTTLFLEGYAAAGDGGQGATYTRRLSAPVPVEPWHVQSADGAWFELKVHRVTPGMFGATGTPDDTAAFSALERFAPGAKIDLGGKVHNVTAEPKGAVYENGRFIVSGTAVSLDRTAKNHAFDGAQSTIIRWDGNSHVWAGPLVYLPEIDTITVTWISAITHDVGSPSAVYFGYLQNGVDIREPVVMFSRTDRAVQNTHGGRGAGGRLIYLHSCFDPTAGNAPKTVLSYTDNNGASFTNFDATMPNQWELGYGPTLTDPDPNKLHMFGYGGGKIIHAWTTGNGTGVSSNIAIAAAGLLVEPWVERIDALRAFMILRDDAGGSLQISLSSDNLQTWSAPVPMGITGGANPVSAYIRNGNLYVSVYARRGAEIYGRADVQLYWQTPVEPLWAAGGVMPLADRGPRANLSGKTNVLGYDYFADVKGQLVRAFSAGEDALGSANATSSQLMLQTELTPTLAAPAIVKYLRPGPNLLENGCFTKSQRGTSFTSASPFMWADRWAFTQNGGGSATVALSTVPAGFGKWYPHSPQSAWLFSGGGNSPYKAIYQRSGDRDLMYHVSSVPLTLQLWGLGSMPGPADALINIATGTGGSPPVVSTATLVFKGQVQPFGAWHLEAPLSGFDLTNVTLGANAIMSVLFRFSGAAPMGGYLLGAKLERGDASPLEYGDGDEIEQMLRHYESRTFAPNSTVGMAAGNGGAVTEIALGFTPKRTIPFVSASAVNALVVGSVATSNLMIDSVSTQSCRLNATLAAGNLADGNARLVRAGSGITFNIDAEFAP